MTQYFPDATLLGARVQLVTTGQTGLVVQFDAPSDIKLELEDGSGQTWCLVSEVIRLLDNAPPLAVDCPPDEKFVDLFCRRVQIIATGQTGLVVAVGPDNQIQVQCDDGTGVRTTKGAVFPLSPPAESDCDQDEAVGVI